MALKKSDLYSSLWASCDELRGGMDASQYKDYVLFMLFIKYVTDKYGNSNDFAPPVTIPKGASFTDMIALKGKSDIGDRINKEVIAPLVEANSRLARSDFPDFNDPNKLGEGKDMVDKISNLVGIFQNPALDFSKNRAEHDDILGDAYEYLMRHFATESGKSKGQFYTPSEVSRTIAQVIGITPQNTKAATTAYDPTCGSGSLLLKVAAQSGKHITLEGQEKDVTTAGLARMNMILHNFPTANIISGNTLAAPKFKDGEQLRTYDYVVANPPFSDKTWSTGLIPSDDQYQRFEWGEPPGKQGDYAYLLHIIRSMKSKGKAACILPHGVLFRGNAEAVIREKLVRSGYLKGIIGLPANLFYGTGIPACILVLDKENAPTRKGVFLIDASKGFIKDGNKNRLREQDIHKIVDTFQKQIETPGYARLVGFDEIKKHEFNLNLPRYIDSTEAEDIQDIDGHLRGGIPLRDVEGLAPYWAVCPNLQKALFKKYRAGYIALAVDKTAIKSTIFDHTEFRAFVAGVNAHFDAWRSAAIKSLKGLKPGCHPKQVIAEQSEGLLRHFHGQPLVDDYDLYQHFMNYWVGTMQDDCYVISADGWMKGAQPREILKVKNKDNKLVWPEEHDYLKGKRRFKSDLVPATILVARYFLKERQAIEVLDAELAALEQQLDEMREENSGDEGLLTEVIEGEGEKQKITAKAVRDRLKEIGNDPNLADERKALQAYAKLLERQSDTKTKRKEAQEELDAKIDAKYPTLTEAEVKTLVVEDKWLAALDAALHGELDGVSQTLTTRVKELADRYDIPLPNLTDYVADLEAKVNGHLERMLTSQKRNQDYTQTELGPFPADWLSKTIGSFQPFVTSGSRGWAQYYAERGDLFVRITNMTRSSIYLDLSDSKFVRLPATGHEGARTQLQTGDLLVSVTADIGIISWVDESIPSPGYINQHIALVRFSSLEVSSLFIAYFLAHVPSQQRFRAITDQGAKAGINLATVQEVQLVMPPTKAEQEAIAAILSDMDAEIAGLEAKLGKARLVKAGMMQELLTGKTRLVKPGGSDA